jgi:hypothetical protein
MASSAQEFIDRVIHLVLNSGAQVTLSPRTQILPGDRLGVLRGKAIYDSGHQLHFVTVVNTSSAPPTLRKYKFHLMEANGDEVFRYDNTSHHRQIGTFPHHKHVGPTGTIVESSPPDIETILAEVSAHVGRDKP